MNATTEARTLGFHRARFSFLNRFFYPQRLFILGEVGLHYWLKKWLFVLSLAIALLIPFSVWAMKTLWWNAYQQTWDLPMDAYGMLIIMMITLLLIALVSVITRPVPDRSRSKAKHFALLLMTLALNVSFWWILWVMFAGIGFT
jgi:hypothetical protein